LEELEDFLDFIREDLWNRLREEADPNILSSQLLSL
jgi:hypothetical protein